MLKMEPRIPLVIFFSSLASLAFEVLLSRIFAITLGYHFAFMVISIAMLGFAASGTILALFPGLKRLDRLGVYTLALAAAMPGGYLLANRITFDPVRLAWERWELLHIFPLYLCLALPFFCTGLLIATAFSLENHRAGLLYGADLVGAGVGSLGILALLTYAPPEQGIFILALLVCAAACLCGGRRLRLAAFFLGGILLALFLLHPAWTQPRPSPYQGLEAALRFPGAAHLRTWHTPFARIDTFQSPAVRYAPGLSLRYLDELPQQLGISVDGGEVTAVTAVADPAALAFLEQLPAALPYALAPRRAVLILDPQGGLPILLARRQGAERIASVEGTAALEQVIRTELREFSGGLYEQGSRVGLGRAWLAQGEERFDLIDITLQGTTPAAAYGIGEDYRFTVEAVREYLQHLSPDGVLTFNLFILPPARSELRILATLATAFEELGIQEPGEHIAAIRSWGTLTIVAKRTPLTRAESASVRHFAEERRFDLVWLPGATAAESQRYIKTTDNDFAAFRALLAPAEREAFLAAYLFNVRPVRDEAPFFSHFLRLDRIGDTYRHMGAKWQFFLEGGYLLPAILLQALGISAVLLLLPALVQRGENTERGIRRRFLAYFALLGLAYLFVEVALIQKFILPLENPPVAVAAVLASLLIASGGGSLLSQRYPRLARPGFLLVLAFLVALLALLLPSLFTLATPWPLPLRGIFLCLLLTLPGALMGIPFPTGLRLLGQLAPELIPWAWTVNGVFSVLAPLLAVMLALVTGFQGVLFCGAGAYLLAFLLIRSFALDSD